MYVTIDLEAGTAGLADPDNFQQFHVVVPGGDLEGSLRVLGADGADADLADHIWISVAAIRRWAGERGDSDWEAGFGKMLEYAGSKGWLDDDATHIQAHIEPKGS